MSERIYKRGEVWHCWYYRAGQQVRESTRCTDRRAALAYLRDREREAQGAGDPAPPPAYRLSVALHAIYNDESSGRASATLDMYQVKGGHLLRLLGDIDITALRMIDVDGYVAARLAEDVARETVRKELVTLRRALVMAKSRGHLTYDPRTVIPEFRSSYVPKERYLTEDEADALLAALPVPDPERPGVRQDRRLWVLVAIYTGGRSSEVSGLRWEHVDLAGGWILLPGTKTRRSRRRVPIAEPLRVELAKVVKAKRTGPVVGAWSNVRRDLALYCDEGHAGIPPVSPNDLRRTYASWLAQRGVPLIVIARLLGHSSTRMVDLVYGHLAADDLTAAVATLGHRKRLSRPHHTAGKAKAKRKRLRLVA